MRVLMKETVMYARETELVWEIIWEENGQSVEGRVRESVWECIVGWIKDQTEFFNV